MRIPVQYLYPSPGARISEKMTVRRFVPSTEHNAEAPQLDVRFQHLPQTPLIRLYVSGDHHVPQVPRAADEIVASR